MKTIDFYIDTARENTGATSDLKLAAMLDLKSSAISYWRTGKTFPSDDTMIKLAELADISPEQALLELSYWRADGKAQKVYKGLISRLTGAVACLVIVIVSMFSAPAFAENTSRTDNSYVNSNIYYQSIGVDTQTNLSLCRSHQILVQHRYILYT